MQSVTGPGRVVAGRYELLEPVGRGAMGTVWRARDLRLARHVAVKEVRLPGLMSLQDRSVLRERSLREARVAARLNHPGVVTVHDVIETEGRPWIIMELVPSKSLAQALAEDGPVSPARAAVIGMTLLDALGSAHAAGVVHRDVKPGNILVTPDGRVVLTDFGIATLHGDPGLTQAGMVMGTPGFCAPERIRGEPASPASDLWSLGATLYAAVEGRGPYEGQGSAMAVLANIVHGEPPVAPSAGSLGPVITALMARDPAARPDAATACRMLAAACDGSGRAAAGPADRGASPRPDATLAFPGNPYPDDDLAAVAGQPPAATELAETVSARPGHPAASLATTVTGQASPPGAEFPGAEFPGAELGGEFSSAGFPGAEPGGAPFAGAEVAGAQFAGAEFGSAGPGFAAAASSQTPAGAATAPVGRTPGGGQRRPGRHRRALLFGGGGAAVVLAVLMVALAVSHAARLQAIKRTAATGVIAPALALPAGYRWYTEQPSATPRQAGFSMAVPDGWRASQQGGTTLLENPATTATITVTRAAPGAAGPLRSARALAGESHAPYPGYHQIAVLPVPFHGTVAGAWRFAYQRPGTGNVQVLELVARLDTGLGAQSYELAVTSPWRSWLASRAAFTEAMRVFTPQP